jgi:hypothetical protein
MMTCLLSETFSSLLCHDLPALALTVSWFATGGVPEGRQHLLPQECQISGHNGAEYAELPIASFSSSFSLMPKGAKG